MTAPVADRLLAAFASSDVDALRALCRDDVVVFGTDAGERWAGLGELGPALEAMRELELEASWTAPPAGGESWAAGIARYSGARMDPVDVRVTFAFDAGGQLAHAHFSVEAPVA